MSTDKPNINLDAMSEPDSSLAAAAGLSANNTSKPQRVLACLLCQQRKIKCDRKFPCANCARAGAKCVPAGLVPRQRRRRFPERELLDRIRNYEALLHQNNVAFEPLHPSALATPPVGDLSSQSLDVAPSPAGALSGAGEQGTAAKPRSANFWHAVSLSQKVKGNHSEDDVDDDGESNDEEDGGFLHNDDDLRGAAIKKAWEHTYHGSQENSQHLLFSSPGSTSHISLTTSHPDQAGIFRLWQIYLENVDPLLKITHTPTLQAGIVNAVGDLRAVSPQLEALLFGIYCVSILSLADDKCQALFGSLKLDLLTGYQFACRQALVNCQFLQSDHHDCLAALYLYLISIKPASDPRAVSSMLAVAIRTAQRMGYHHEASNAKCNALESELRRRLWWSLAIFDNRVCEIFHYKTATLGPTWDCNPPQNLSDFELRPESKIAPPVSDKPTEAFFVVMRSKLSDFVRHSAFHLDFIDPLLTTFAHAKNATRNAGHASLPDLPELQREMEERLRLCDMGNPLQFLTVWLTRGSLAKNFLLKHCWRHSTSPTQSSNEQVNAAIPYALQMLDCDTRIMSSSLTRGYIWLMQSQFPLLAYAYILQHLKKWPAEDYAEQAWREMSNNYEARGMNSNQIMYKPFYILLSRMILLAWEACEAAADRNGRPRDPPAIVADIKSKLPALPGRLAAEALGGLGGLPVTLSDTPTTMAVDVAVSGAAAAGPMPFAVPGISTGFYDTTGPAMPDMVGMDQLWPAMHWGMMEPQRPW